METSTTLSRRLDGVTRLRRVGRSGFPAEELVNDQGLVARLGRDSSLAIFFGSGRRVVLADGVEWRIKAATLGRHIVPIIKSPAGTVAYSGPLDGKRSYGITGKDFGYHLLPLGRPGIRRPAVWEVREHHTRVGLVDDRDRSIEALESLPVAAVILVFTLVTHGVPGEADLIPRPV